MHAALDRIPGFVTVFGAVLLLPLVALPALSNVWNLAAAESSFDNQIAIPLGSWLSNNTPNDSTVCLETIGAVGWYSNRRILDEGGLVSEKTRALNEQTPGKINVPGILETFQPDYYVARDLERKALRADPSTWAWMNETYEEIAQCSDPGHGYTWVLFRKRNGPSRVPGQ